MIERIKDWFWFFRILSNWHKLPLLSKMMCRFGRHDYEAYLLESDCAWMSCFYCQRRKKSFAPNINTKLH